MEPNRDAGRATAVERMALRVTATSDRVRRRSRSPLARRIVVGRIGAMLLAVAVAATVLSLVTDAEADRRRWGEVVPVVVARRALAAGTEPGPDDLEVRQWPSGLVPRGAVSAIPRRRLSAPLVPGEVVLDSRLARQGAGPAAARLPPGGAAVTVPLGPAQPAIEVGDRVDVLAAPGRDPWQPDPPDDTAAIVAESAEVIALEGDHATLVVDRSELERTAAAILNGGLTVALIG